MTRVDPRAYLIDPTQYAISDLRWMHDLDDRVLHTGLPHQRMGTRTLDPRRWLVFDGQAEAELDLRRRLFTDAPGEVFRATESSTAAQAETAALVEAWLRRHRPAALARWGSADLAPLVRAGLAVQEDLCVMERADDGWRFTAGFVCFPTYWSLEDKIDRPQETIHGPVPHYADDLADKVTRLFDRLAVDSIVTRRNWGFAGHPLLFVPRLSDLEQPDVFDPDRCWLRSERQTLRRLPASGAILFTIKVQLAPVAALRVWPAVAGRLLDSMADWSPELLASRGQQPWMPGLRRFLARVADR
ncbi:MAG: DUF3445 domain-containing protein [Actinomycetota bacterium]